MTYGKDILHELPKPKRLSAAPPSRACLGEAASGRRRGCRRRLLIRRGGGGEFSDSENLRNTSVMGVRNPDVSAVRPRHACRARKGTDDARCRQHLHSGKPNVVRPLLTVGVPFFSVTAALQICNSQAANRNFSCPAACGQFNRGSMKRSLRKEMRAVLAAMSAKVASEKSRLACARLMAMDEFRRAETIMLFFEHARGGGHLRRRAGGLAGGQDRPCAASELGRSSPRTDGGSLAGDGPGDDRPQNSASPIRANHGALRRSTLWRCRRFAFDRKGNRLGRGMGFYDRFLSHRQVKAFTCGLAFSEQVVDGLPTTANDFPVNALVTDQEVLRF